MAKPAPRDAAPAAILGQNSYGKSRVRMLKVSRDASSGRHTIREISVDIALQGDFEDVHCRGDNSKCLPTDTMKNTVYALGKDHPLESIESFALHLSDHFLRDNPQVNSARIRISQTSWDRVSVKDREHSHCFTKGSQERAVCQATVSRDGATVTAGIEDLVILKSTDSAFAGYVKDKFTTLPETEDRILATSVKATWDFAGPDPRAANFAQARTLIRQAVIDAFAAHKSKSVQHTLYQMGAAALQASPAIARIHLSMPNKHYLLANLKPFGLDNANEIFVPTDEPHGLIEATVERRQ